MKLWKKVLSVATAGVLCLGSVGVTGMQSVLESVGTVLSASAYVPEWYDGTYGDLYYSIYSNDSGWEISISGCSEDVESVEIPAEIDGKPVTGIGGYAFSSCTNLTEIIIPDSVKNIDSKAFYGTPWFAAKLEENQLVVVNGILIDGTTCTGSVTIPDSVTSIGNQAFYNCTNLTEITISDSVTMIGWGAFENCTSTP